MKMNWVKIGPLKSQKPCLRDSFSVMTQCSPDYPHISHKTWSCQQQSPKPSSVLPAPHAQPVCSEMCPEQETSCAPIDQGHLCTWVSIWTSHGIPRARPSEERRKGSQALGEASNDAATTACWSAQSRTLLPSWTRSTSQFSWPPARLTSLSLLLSFSHEPTQVS